MKLGERLDKETTMLPANGKERTRKRQYGYMKKNELQGAVVKEDTWNAGEG